MACHPLLKCVATHHHLPFGLVYRVNQMCGAALLSHPIYVYD